MNPITTLLPAPLKSALEDARALSRDALDELLGRRDPLIPPTRLMFDGARDVATFKQNGQEFLKYFIQLGELQPYESVLDVGCGIGRKTFPLTGYLNEQGRYEGFDIVRTGIRWCQKTISKQYPNFHFQWVDVYNRYYNPQGRTRASEFEFPFADQTFDFVILGSVFTHLLPDDLENYFGQVARVLKKGGRCLITFFLLNPESLDLIAAHRSTMRLEFDHGIYRTADAAQPELAVGYDESFILEQYARRGLALEPPLHYGLWCGRREFLSYQDIIVATKV